jgi:hypothetical protein
MVSPLNRHFGIQRERDDEYLTVEVDDEPAALPQMCLCCGFNRWSKTHSAGIDAKYGQNCPKIFVAGFRPTC